MKILMHATLAHPDYAASSGQTVVVPDDVADQLIRDGYASPVDEPDAHRRRPVFGPADLVSQSVGVVLDYAASSTADEIADLLAAEQAKPKPRKSLVQGLEALLAEPDASPEPDDVDEPDAE